LLSLCEFQLFLTQLFGKVVDLHLPFEFMGELYNYIKGEEQLLYQRKRKRGEHRVSTEDKGSDGDAFVDELVWKEKNEELEDLKQ
jgi:hypothetical protein